MVRSSDLRSGSALVNLAPFGSFSLLNITGVTSTILPAPDLVNSNSIAVQTEVGGPHPKTYLSAPMA